MAKIEIEHHFEGFFAGKKVLITGHTGFKGSWLSILLHQLGAQVYGYALTPPTNPSLFELAGVDKLVQSTIGDIRDFELLSTVMQQIKPEIVIHMAAQPLVNLSYKNPRETYEVNVIGTVNLFEAVRLTGGVKAIVNVTTDKCYENNEWHWGYRENDRLGGFDPYSNSKACSELVTSAFTNSFFNPANYNIHGTAIASARAGNVIGGGDWAEDRLIPDIFRSIEKNEKVKIRYPYAIRPWQHVLEPLTGYLILSKNLYERGVDFSGAWNFASNDDDAKNVEWITKHICEFWGEKADFEIENKIHNHEANFLKLDCSKAKSELKWYPKWNIISTLQSIVDWNKACYLQNNMLEITQKQISDFLESDI